MGDENGVWEDGGREADRVQPGRREGGREGADEAGGIEGGRGGREE